MVSKIEETVGEMPKTPIGSQTEREIQRKFEAIPNFEEMSHQAIENWLNNYLQQNNKP